MSIQNPFDRPDVDLPTADPIGVGESITGLPAAMPGFLPGFATPMFDPWNYRDDVERDPTDLRGFHVEATDGRIGKVESVSDVRDRAHLAVDTGPWIFGRTVVIPAGSVNHIDYHEHVVYLDRTKEQIKAAPPIDVAAVDDDTHRQTLHEYYRDSYHSAQ